MKLLFDENLSRRLCQKLEDIFPDCKQVCLVGLENVDDRDIWQYAAKEGLTIVSKDGDFHDLSFLLGAPPKVIWLRIGNCTTDLAEAVIRRNIEAIKSFENSDEAAILVLEA